MKTKIEVQAAVKIADGHIESAIKKRSPTQLLHWEGVKAALLFVLGESQLYSHSQSTTPKPDPDSAPSSDESTGQQSPAAGQQAGPGEDGSESQSLRLGCRDSGIEQ